VGRCLRALRRNLGTFIRLIAGFGRERGASAIANERGTSMARYIDHRQAHDYSNTDWQRVAAFYGFVIGLLLTKTGPVTISQEDIDLYGMARLRPFVESHDDIAGIKAYLLGEDEWPKEDVPVSPWRV